VRLAKNELHFALSIRRRGRECQPQMTIPLADAASPG
jgi:hypothetical protein